LLSEPFDIHPAAPTARAEMLAPSSSRRVIRTCRDCPGLGIGVAVAGAAVVASVVRADTVAVAGAVLIGSTIVAVADVAVVILVVIASKRGVSEAAAAEKGPKAPARSRSLSDISALSAPEERSSSEPSFASLTKTPPAPIEVAETTR
jgi:hypothetical protein